MPYYEYRCRDCGERFEIRAPMSAKPEHPQCSRCQGNNTESVFTPFAIGGSAWRSAGSSGSCSGCSGGSCSTCH